MLVTTQRCRPDVGMLLLAALLAATGVAVYALDRGGAVYFLFGWTSTSAISLFGPFADHLPTFLHTLVFILITAAILQPWPRTLAANCATWFFIECVFEVGQMAPIDSHIAAAVPAWFDNVAVLRITANYFTAGTYDPLDVLSIGIGAVIAYPLVRMYLRGG